jgi:NADH-quinone oxidoreductase subunit J
MAAALLGGAVLLAGLLLAISAAPRLSASAPAPPPPPRAGAADVGRALFGAELVPFELTAILLLVAIVGAVTLWRRQEAERA